MLGVILAGGDNTRYPLPKGLIEVRGQRIVERQVELLNSLGLSPVISANMPEHYGYLDLPMIADRVRRAGPMSGIVSVFEKTGESEMFFMACDMPFIRPEMIEYIIEVRGGEATVPSPGGSAEPLLAVYTAGAAAKMRRLIEEGRTSMRDALSALDVRVVSDEEINKIDPRGESFININTPDDLKAALEAGMGT